MANSQPDIEILFDDIVGLDEAKKKFTEILLFLKKPECYKRVGAEIPKGTLLVGPSGVGKTLLVKAIANEANVPFYSLTGSDFVEMFIGVGANRIRNLFKLAAENAPCLIFIDEIDAVGRKRGGSADNTNDEREQTLNQLLAEMDGFAQKKEIIIVAATNRPNILDPALLRPGRFDRQITLGFPDRLSRINILQVHAKNKPLCQNVSVNHLANRTPGFSGADLANLVYEAAILATRYKKPVITENEINEAFDRVITGPIGNTLKNTKIKKSIAYHEIGHAIIGSLLKDHEKVEKVTLIPHTDTNGFTLFVPGINRTLPYHTALISKIVTTLGGWVTEKIIFGDAEITTSAKQDLRQATIIAYQMITQYGMSIIGPITLKNDNLNRTSLNFEGNNSINNKISSEVYKIIDYCEQIAVKIVQANRPLVDLLVEKLLENEVIPGIEFQMLIKKYTVFPKKIS